MLADIKPTFGECAMLAKGFRPSAKETRAKTFG